MIERGPFTLPETESALVAGLAGREYRLDLAIPQGVAPPAGWPAVYLLEGAGSFGTTVEALWRMGRKTGATGVAPAVVVGIASPDGGYDVPRRQRDFTTPRAGDGPEAGGAEAFLDLVERTVKPLVAARCAVDRRRETLVGHSLGGYFALWVMLERTRSFARYAAVSPSIWWDRDRLFASAAKLVADPSLRAMICIGEWEDELPPWQSVAPDSADVRARRAARRMVDSARDLSAVIQRGVGEDALRFMVLPEEDHASIVSTAIPRVLRLASLA